MSAGALIVGGVLSLTVTSCAAVAPLPEASLTVYVKVVVPIGKKFAAGTPERLIVPRPGQLSDALALPRSAAAMVSPATVDPAPVPRLIPAGTVITGAALSRTVTDCVALPVWPAASVAVQVTMVVPFGKLAGALFAMTSDAPDDTASVALAEPSAGAAAQVPRAVLVVIAGGAVTVGGVVSCAVALQLTMCEPIEKVEPETGLHEGVIAPSTVSFALALKVTTAPLRDVASASNDAGTVKAGGIVS